MSDWFSVGLWIGLGYAASGIVVFAAILVIAVLYFCIRIALGYFKIKKWDP